MEKDNLLKSFQIPLYTLCGIIIYLIFNFLHMELLALPIIILTIIVGSFQLFRDSYYAVLKNEFALDYIAIIAIIVSIIGNNYLVASVLALMIASGRTLESYGAKQAKQSLTSLVDRIPRDVHLWENDEIGKKISVEDVDVGQEVFIRKGEVIPLDGKLVSEGAFIDESSLTGEAFPVEKVKDDEIRSGTVNIGNPIVIHITREEKNSTYTKIVSLVQKAEKEKAPLVRLADKYSTIFTVITFIIAAFAFFYSHSLQGVLAVLVVATPCPLILATPIALMGGVNAAAKRRIIVKKLASLETLSQVNAVMFDKTGTITLGKPQVINVTIFEKEHEKEKIVAIAEAIERNSLHPLGKAIVRYAREENVKMLHAQNIIETIGEGIAGVIDGEEYSLTQVENQATSDMAIALLHNKKIIAVFSFEDQIKEDSRAIVKKLQELGLLIFIFTGDKQERADIVAHKLGGDITVEAECTPEDKERGIERLKNAKKKTAMVGDGINDAPALAKADVGMVFSNEEQTAASEAADIVFLGGDFSLVLESFIIAKRSIHIAMQSIVWGIGLSVLAMLFASVGFIPPLYGAGLQEAIDVAVILNALRASR